jgi:predicted NUDIX family NTP pyrophosphohydrolase
MVDSKGRIGRVRRCARCSETRTAGRNGHRCRRGLGTFKQPSGKLISAWAIERDFDPVELRSNTCSMERPPKSGRTVDVPEVDRAAPRTY